MYISFEIVNYTVVYKVCCCNPNSKTQSLGCVHRKFENKIYMDFLFLLLLCPHEYLCKCHFLTLLNDPMHVFVFCCCLTSCCRELVVQTLSLWSWQCFTNIKLHKSSRKVSFRHFQIAIIVMVDVHISTSVNFCNHL